MFYAEPRLVVHIDQFAIEAIGEYLSGALPSGGVILDLMSSWRSHLPEGQPRGKVVGLGLNAVEMRENPQLDESVVHDLNANPALPFRDDTLDAAILTVSVQYLTKPELVFGEVARVLKPGARFHVIFSNRMFPTKATAIWKALSDEDRGRLVGAYFRRSGGGGSLRRGISARGSGFTAILCMWCQGRWWCRLGVNYEVRLCLWQTHATRER